MANIIVSFDENSVTQNTQKWQYRDIGFPFDDDISSNVDVNAIRGSISNILHWKKGQRILNPQFGNDLNSFLYEIMNNATISNIEKSVEALLSLEPRINVINIDVVPKNEHNEIIINVQYAIISISQVIDDTIIIK